MCADIEAVGARFGFFGIRRSGGAGKVFAALRFGFSASSAFFLVFLLPGFGFGGIFITIPGFAEGSVVCGGFGRGGHGSVGLSLGRCSGRRKGFVYLSDTHSA